MIQITVTNTDHPYNNRKAQSHTMRSDQKKSMFIWILILHITKILFDASIVCQEEHQYCDKVLYRNFPKLTFETYPNMKYLWKNFKRSAPVLIPIQ